MLKKIDHIGIAVESIEEAIKLYTGILGLELGGIEVLESAGVKIAMIPVGDSKLELVEPMHSESVISNFINKRGEGLHHLAFEVSDIDAALAVLKAGRVPLVDKTPRNGANGARIAFLKPAGANRVSIELVELRK